MKKRPNRMTGIYQNCKCCDKEYYVYKCNIGKSKYCSSKCFHASNKPMLDPKNRENQKLGMEKYYNSVRVTGKRKCTQCEKQKSESLFSHQKSKFKNTGICKKCKGKTDRKYYKNNREKCLKYFSDRLKDPELHKKVLISQTISTSKKRCGFDRTKVILPNTRCSLCGITQAQHLRKYRKKNGQGISLNIHHIDNNGRVAEAMGLKPNNSPDNLMILCSSCHTRQHNFERDYTDRGYLIWESRRKNKKINKNNIK